MKQLELELKDGGFPLRLNDLEHLQRGIIESLSPIHNFFLSSEHDALYLKRAIFSFDGSGNYWHTEGVLYWNNEVFSIPERLEADKVPTSYHFVVETTYTPEAGITYRSGNTEFVRADRFISLADVTLLDPEDYVKSGIPTIGEVFDEKLIQYNESGWTNSGLVLAVDWSEDEQIEYKVDGTLIKWRGAVSYTGTSNNPDLFTSIPVAIRPSINKRTIAPVIMASQSSAAITWRASGVVSIGNYIDDGTERLFSLDTSRYWIR